MYRTYKSKSRKVTKSQVRRNGLTLIELLISAMIISAMLGAIWLIFHTGFTVFYGTVARQNIQSQASFAFATMTNELHQASSITAATDRSVTFTADTNNDGIYETIQYTWSGTAGAPLNRVSGLTTTALVRSVNNPLPLSANPLFNYFGTNNTALGTAPTVSQVRLILIDLYTTSSSETFHLRTKVQLRCI